MRTIDELENLLAEACGVVAEAANDTLILSSERSERAKRLLAGALMKLWEVREMVYEQEPRLKPSDLG